MDVLLMRARFVLISLLAAVPPLMLSATGAANPPRLEIPADAILPEAGRCYVATFDFGEPGDADTNNGSGLVLFEDGVPIGPAHSPHVGIRESGGGRYSHWQRTRLYFSSSDGSDPRTNERLYEVASTNPGSMLQGVSDLPFTPHEHVESVADPYREYTVSMGGTLDMENTRIVSTSTCRVAFQPNVELVLANTGTTPVVNPRLVVNGRGDWGSLESLLAEWTAGARDQQETAMFLWQNMRNHTYHLEPLFLSAYPHDPVRLFNVQGFNLCDDAGIAGTTLFLAAGLEGSTTRHLFGHVQCEAMVDGRLQFLDVDQDCFYLDRENERPVSGDELAHDHDLVRRELNYGPVTSSYRTSEELASLFGPDDIQVVRSVSGHRMDYVLRPGERVVFRWDNAGKIAAQDAEHVRRPPYFGNSRFEYKPRLSTALLTSDGLAHAGWADLPGGGLRAGVDGAELEVGMKVPWLVCGGRVDLELKDGASGSRFVLEIRSRDAPWTSVWESSGPGDLRASITLDEALQVRRAAPLEEYRIRLRASGPGVELHSLSLSTDILTAPLSLPRLRLGENRVVYRDDSAGARDVTITHCWRETSAVRPPSPPLALSPASAASVAADRVTYGWSRVPGARRYRLQVSLRPDFAWPYRPGLDVAIPDTTWTVPFEGIYSPGVTYYWRLRTMDRRGIWGDWSPTRNFTWDGPRTPVELAAVVGDGRISLAWEPNPRGPRPVAYEVYGSDIRGFSIARIAHDEAGLGRQPANLLARTSLNSLEVVGPGAAGPAAGRAFYRVVAIDAAGTRSGPSDYLELPRPFLHGVPEREAVAGSPYVSRLRSLASVGDLQQRERPTGGSVRSFCEGDSVRFALVHAPEWLSVDPVSGELSGVPPVAGRFRVVAEAMDRRGGCATDEWEIKVRPATAASAAAAIGQ